LHNDSVTKILIQHILSIEKRENMENSYCVMYIYNIVVYKYTWHSKS